MNWRNENAYRSGKEYTRFCQNIVSAVLMGVPKKEVRRRYGVSKRQLKSILRRANIRTPDDGPKLPDKGKVALIEEGSAGRKNRVLVVRQDYDDIAGKHPVGATEALQEHRALKSKLQDVPAQTLTWYYTWTTPRISIEHMLFDMHEFIKFMLSHSAPAYAACTGIGLRLRKSKALPALPEVVREEITLQAEQWWRDPKIVQWLKNNTKVSVNPFEDFGVI